MALCELFELASRRPTTVSPSGAASLHRISAAPLDDPFPGPAQTAVLSAGAYLFRQGDPAAAIYYVESGCLRLERYTPAGITVVLHTARAGDLLAEAALVTTTYHCNAIALRESRVRVYAKTAILANLPPGSPGYALVAVMAHQLIKARQRIELRDIRSARDRVMLYLEQQADREGDVEIGGELQDIAVELGLSREALYRALAALQRENRIRRYRRHISVVKP